MKTPTEVEIRDSLAFLKYQDTYARVMHEFLGWPLARGKQEVDQLIRNESVRTWFGHCTAAADATPHIVAARLSPEAIEAAGGSILYREVCAAIEGSLEQWDPHPDTIPSYDWEAARDRVNLILRKHEGPSPT